MANIDANSIENVKLHIKNHCDANLFAACQLHFSNFEWLAVLFLVFSVFIFKRKNSQPSNFIDCEEKKRQQEWECERKMRWGREGERECINKSNATRQTFIINLFYIAEFSECSAYRRSLLLLWNISICFAEKCQFNSVWFVIGCL